MREWKIAVAFPCIFDFLSFFVRESQTLFDGTVVFYFAGSHEHRTARGRRRKASGRVQLDVPARKV